MKKYFILAAAALAFAACSNKEDFVAEPQAEQQVGEVPVAFDSYVNRSTTRSGYAGELTTKTGTNNLQTEGFGVFAYYTDNCDYDYTATPNFMYNQKVTYSTGWTYEPVKYWPNEYGSAAESENTDKLTFFAYAPYVNVVASTGKVNDTPDNQTWGITGFTKNAAAGDPLVKYIVNFDASKSVDLLWGTVPTDLASAWNTTQTGSPQTPALTAGIPWLDVERPKDATGTQKVKFDFKHATSKLNVQIAYYADKQSNTLSEEINETNTKIFVRSITFKGFATKGALNLNNTIADKALWMAYNGVDDLESGESVTICDGRKDGKEGVNGAVSTTEKITGLNTQIIQGDPGTGTNYTARYKKGVTKDLQNLFVSTTADDPIFVIPTGEEVTVEIVYDVETEDINLAGFLSDGKTHGSTIENRISKTISFGGTNKFENGKAYILKLYLGMNSVKFDAFVTPWSDPATSENVDLPGNQNS